MIRQMEGVQVIVPGANVKHSIRNDGGEFRTMKDVVAPRIALVEASSA
jgi:hypothetical protein